MDNEGKRESNNWISLYQDIDDMLSDEQKNEMAIIEYAIYYPTIYSPNKLIDT